MNPEPLTAHPRTMKEVCAHYRVSYRTMCKLMQRAGLAHLLRRRGRGMYYFQISELAQIEAAFSQAELEFGEN